METLFGKVFFCISMLIAALVAWKPIVFLRLASYGRYRAGEIAPRTILIFRCIAAYMAISVAISLLGSATEPTLAADDRTADRAQITTVLSNVEDAWNRHDMRALAAQFHEDGIWVLWTGDVWSGRKPIEEGHAAVHKTVFRNSIQRERLEELTFLGPDAAIMRYCSVLTGDERAPDKVIRSRKVLVLTKRDGAWKIGWGQNTRLLDTVPDSDCFVALRKSAESDARAISQSAPGSPVPNRTS